MYSFESNSTLIPILNDIDDAIVSSIKGCLIHEQELIDSDPSIQHSIVVYLLAISCSILIGLSGLLPLIFTFQDSNCTKNLTGNSKENDSYSLIQRTKMNTKNTTYHSGVERDEMEKQQTSSLFDLSIENSNMPKINCTKVHLKYMLSFAVGSLLGDVFLNLLPQTYFSLYKSAKMNKEPETFTKIGHITIGIWIISGLFVFIFVEMLYSSTKQNLDSTDTNCQEDIKTKSISVTPSMGDIQSVVAKTTDRRNNAQGSIAYLNIFANSIDNFFNGVGVGIAFIKSIKIGCITTLCILLHEIPNGLGDFAILIKSGFTQNYAVVAQLLIAMLGLIGTCIALFLGTIDGLNGMESLESYASWIIPFNCGGFINISLVTLVPDLMDSKDSRDYLQTLGFIVLGIFSIFWITRM